MLTFMMADRDAVPEFVSPWNWGDVEAYEFCRTCGWAGWWTYNENWGGEFCLECGASEHDFDIERYVNPKKGIVSSEFSSYVG